MNKNVPHSTIISIHFGHNATVALLKDGRITDCVSEERFNRIKNSTGFPHKALSYIKNIAGENVEYYVFTQKYPWGYNFLKATGFQSIPYNDVQPTAPKIPLRLRLWEKHYYKKNRDAMLDGINKIESNLALKKEMEDYFSKLLKVPKEKVLYADHHLTHALSAKFFTKQSEDNLVFTLDGEGDGLSSTVSRLNSDDIIVLSRGSKAFSLGYLYREVTAFLGMKPDEHEFKVMGLAPYAKTEHVEKLLPLFEKILWINNKDEFESEIPMPIIKYYLVSNFLYKRFDTIAGAIQLFTEKIVMDWIVRWVRKTNITNICLSGGVAMNVKMNERIAELAEVSSLSVVPSAGDESTVFGGCFVGYKRFCDDHKLKCTVTPVTDLYLGTSYSHPEIEKFLLANNYFEKYNISEPQNIELTVAQLLADNNVVARFSGRMEFGARALGNRSILANPRSYENVRIINEMIKNRDFWMPFAASILEEDEGRYIINPKKIPSDFMAITFNTTPSAQVDLIGSIHPYDKTSRPQIVKKMTNPGYHELISEFKRITGVGGILNTSFNLHGEPNVESPADAMHTFKNSGLNYMAIGSFLIAKKESSH